MFLRGLEVTIIRAYSTINPPKVWFWSILLSYHRTYLSGNLIRYILKRGTINERKQLINIEIAAFTDYKNENHSMLSSDSGLYVDQPCFSSIIMVLVTSLQKKMTLLDNLIH